MPPGSIPSGPPDPRSEPSRSGTDERRLRLLVTGAAGRIGSDLRPHLRERYDLRLHDRVEVPDPRPGETVVTGDLTDAASLRDAVRGADAVLHLAVVHGIDLRFDDAIDANFRGTMQLLDAIRSEGVQRFVYASSHHVHGLHRRDGFAGDDASLAPDAVYGLGKAYGELASTSYALRYGVRTLIVRIGNADATVTDDRTLRLWTSARDLAHLIAIGVESPEVVCDVVYGVSVCPGPLYRNRRAELLGYRPVDRAEDHLDPEFLPYDAMPPRLGRDFVGGAYVAADLPDPVGSAPEPATREETT